ncbi:ATP-dependent RNA helicase-like protein DB10 isoform X2 [Nymphaea colorata]|uniref:ATP-dependent RNA helicase-like protein DB10 isoform X2 n=1 Tax=Nymphaea colorata TaxID=210225 RepID=UPI00214F594C|nr:ATP-dependent RNA helicase-like protein DB10 isoform X2 [Nymphaea colorata]
MDSSGPRYAPDDPALPKPWRGLIDGSTGYLYYWNPETNVTQYTRPMPLLTVLPVGPPPRSCPSLAPIPSAQKHDFSSSVDSQTGVSSSYIQQVAPTLSQFHQAMATSNQAQQLGISLHQVPHTVQRPQVPQTGQLVDQVEQTDPGFSQVQQVVTGLSQLPQSESVLSQVNEEGHISFQAPPSRIHLIPQQKGGTLSDIEQTADSLSQVQKREAPSQSQRVAPNCSQAHLGAPPFAPVHQPDMFAYQIQQSGALFHDGHQTRNNSIQVQQMGANNVQERQSSLPSPQAPSGGNSSIQIHQFGPAPMPLQTGIASHPMYDGIDPSSCRTLSLGSAPVVNSHQCVGSSVAACKNHEDDQNGRPCGKSLLHYNNEDNTKITPQNTSAANIVAGSPIVDMYNYCSSGQSYSSGPISKPLGIHGPADLNKFMSVEAYRRHHEVTAVGENVPAPFITFEATGFPSEILREMHSAGFASPTPIQAQTWPVALQGRDIVAIARTGSGKTLGYLIPAFIHLRQCRNNPQIGPTVLVLAPTRELATQIQDEAIKFGQSSRISCTCLYGGAPKGPQLRELERGADIVVATPGRLNDIFDMKKINFSQVSFLVLDEADRMLDMGFEPQIRKIVDEIPCRRQTLMYTATWPKDVRKIAGDLLLNPIQVNIGNVDELEANKAITQLVEVVSQPDKQQRLEQILRSQEQGSKVIVFCSTKRLCDQLVRSIRRNFRAAAIHGDKSQGERDWVLNEFRTGRSPILIATNVAARGLDIKDIRVVINYDFPTGIEDYVHRIGRTGRAGATGISITFFSNQDWKYAADLIKVLEGANQRVPPEVREIATRYENSVKGGRGGGFTRWDSGSRGIHDGADIHIRGPGHRGGKTAPGGGRGDLFNGHGGGYNNKFSGDYSGGHGGAFGGCRNRGRGIGGVPGGRYTGAPHSRLTAIGGQGKFDGQRAGGGRTKFNSHKSSPDKVRTWGYSRSRWRSRSLSSCSRSRSRSPSRSRSRSPSRSRSRSYDRFSRGDGSPARVRSPLLEPLPCLTHTPRGDLVPPILVQAEPGQMPAGSSHEVLT